MGNANQTGNRDQNQALQAIKGWPLLFHQTHSTNIQISPDQRRAKRLETFCNGICFSNRPVSMGEQVILRFTEVSTSWSGVLRFGFTSHDPTSIIAAGLPRYACPDLTNKYGYWAKALPERFALQGNILCFHVCRNGNVMYAINGEDKGLFFGGIVTGQPLWGLIDIYGNSTSVEFIDPRFILSLPLKDSCSPTLTSTFFTSLDSVQGQRTQQLSLPSGHQSLKHNQTHQEHQTNNQNLHHYNQQQHRSLMALGGRSTNHSASLPDMTQPGIPPTSLPVRHHKNLSPLPFHPMVGKNVRLSSDRLVASRVADEYCNGYVFTSRPLRPGEKIVIQILSLDEVFTGGIAFGMTSCDISQLNPSDLPDDADLLLDRPEYWVVNKDVCSNPSLGDELSFHFTSEGEIKYGKNNFHITTLMHVDKEVKLWAFFDVYGQTQKIKALGVATSSLRSSAMRQQQQPIMQQVNLIDGSFQSGFNPPSDLMPYFGNILNPIALVPMPSLCPQSRDETVNEAPPRPPPPLKKSSIPALPPKQGRSTTGFSSESFMRDSPLSMGGIQSQPLSPSRAMLNLDVLSLSSIDSDHSSHCVNSPHFQMKDAIGGDQGVLRFYLSPKSAPSLQKPPVVAPKPTALLRASATFRVPNRRQENVSLPITSAEFPLYSTSSAVVPDDRFITFAQDRNRTKTQGQILPMPSPRSFSGDASKSDPTVRKHPQTTSVTPTSPVPSSMVDGVNSNREESEMRENNECSVCWEQAPDCALYTCGHMCMCYDCALSLKESKDPYCPICRQPIKDIIKIYRS